MTQERQVQPFDEKAALAELERLRDSIQAARRARQRTSAEFDAFIKGFRSPAPAPASESRVATSSVSEAQTSVSEAQAQAASAPVDQPLQPPDEVPSIVAVPPNTDALDDTTVPSASQTVRRYRLNIRLLGMFAVLALIVLGLLSIRWSGRQSPLARTGNATSTGSTAKSTPAATPTAPSTASPPAAPRGVVLELRTVKPVWMRVVVDGRKEVEGTVQEGKPLRFTGDSSIVVRVGNGGDVLVKTGDREESFGDAGQPLTRTFSKR